jgi:hypothetical protein
MCPRTKKHRPPIIFLSARSGRLDSSSRTGSAVLSSFLDSAIVLAEPVRMPKKKAAVRNPWTKDDVRELRAHSKAGTPAAKVTTALKRTEGGVCQRQDRLALGSGTDGSCSSRGDPLFELRPLLTDFVEEPQSGTAAVAVNGDCQRGKVGPQRLKRRRSAREAGRASPISANSGRWRPVGTRPSPRSDPADAIDRALGYA